MKKTSKISPTSTTFEVGDRVKHRAMNYGEGTIVSIKENSYYPYVIKFDKYEDLESFADISLVLIKKGKSK